jgi:hypothetical protein
MRQFEQWIGSGVVIAEIEITLCGESYDGWLWMEMHNGHKKAFGAAADQIGDKA